MAHKLALPHMPKSAGSNVLRKPCQTSDALTHTVTVAPSHPCALARRASHLHHEGWLIYKVSACHEGARLAHGIDQVQAGR